MAEKKLSNTEVLSLLSKFETEWNQFRGMWDQLTPSFQYMSAVIHRFEEISAAMPLIETQFLETTASLANRERDLMQAKKEISEQLSRHREQLEQELVPLTNELEATRERVFAIQNARTVAERSFEERKRAQEMELREIEERVMSAQRMLDDIGRLAGAIHAR